MSHLWEDVETFMYEDTWELDTTHYETGTWIIWPLESPRSMEAAISPAEGSSSGVV